ncbi:MAG: hypothetical protein SGJ27_10470 [Candidatus Melainabacteria bacterium]|nr:hypothetical protein [Candidatus Melainabacteria bacterium]
MTHKSRSNRKCRTVRIDTLLLANYGILQPTRRHDAITVNTPSLEALTIEEKRDLFEFATFLMDDERQFDFPDSSDDDEDEMLQDE